MLEVLDTNILVSGLPSGLGASNAVLQRVASGDFQVAVSTALVLEYADVLARPGLLPGYNQETISTFLDSYCAVAREAFIYFRWRPFLKDSNDDMVFECALAAGATHIVTHNCRDFNGVAPFGISVMTPADFLNILPAL